MRVSATRRCCPRVNAVASSLATALAWARAGRCDIVCQTIGGRILHLRVVWGAMHAGSRCACLRRTRWPLGRCHRLHIG
eukprot:scaffold207809_cov32-Tisochrysis_lutea.AAC.2